MKDVNPELVAQMEPVDSRAPLVHLLKMEQGVGSSDVDDASVHLHRRVIKRAAWATALLDHFKVVDLAIAQILGTPDSGTCDHPLSRPWPLTSKPPPLPMPKLQDDLGNGEEDDTL